MDFSKYNRANVLKNVEKLIEESEQYKKENRWLGYKQYYIREVCDELSIFDWWNDKLSLSQLKEMRSFLIQAGKYGYNGYVCFKVGATGCANGMWAHKVETTNGYSPDGEFFYRSFTPDYIRYDAELADGTWVSRKFDDRHDLKLKEVVEYIGA